MIRRIAATHYVTPLREGGSLPAIVEGSDDGLWVTKFRGAGQGVRALIAELISGELARALDLPVPEIVFIDIDERLAKTEPDPEVQDLLRASTGMNLALDYLPGSITFDPIVAKPIENHVELASKIVWFDALVTNVDRTPRNTNLLVWHHRLYMIDHGASLYFHHDWRDVENRRRTSFPAIRDHVLLPWGSRIEDVDEEMTERVTEALLDSVLELVPDEWLRDVEAFPTPELHRRAYRDWFTGRLSEPRAWVEEAANARSLLV